MTAVAPGRRVLLLGGSSEIGQAIVLRLLRDGPVAPFLLGRDPGRLADAEAALAAAGCHLLGSAHVDARDLSSHASVIADAFARAGGFELVIAATGVLGAQDGLDADPEEAAEVMEVNFAGTGSLLMHGLRGLRRHGGGAAIVLSSVAAERPRASNAIYGASKAGLDALAQGLSDRIAGSGVRMLVVRAGFVATRMTAGLKPAPMATTPEAVAEATVAALATDAHTVWVPGRLRYVFSILRHLPRPLFARLKL